MCKRYDIVALGELLIDFTPYARSAQGHPVLEENPGGAPCNMLAMASKLGSKTAFIGKVGRDPFGEGLKRAIERQGIDARGLVMDDRYSTTLAFVHLDAAGDRSFSFCRKPGADMMLEEGELDVELLSDCKLFHFGTLSMTHPGVRAATLRALELARAAGATISFDPNIRPPLWPSVEAAKRQMQRGLALCDVLKISDDELRLATGEERLAEAVDALQKRYPNIRLLLVTLGKQGALYRYGALQNQMPTYDRVQTIDTTGAGDTFMGAFLHTVARVGLDGLDGRLLDQTLDFAGAAASLVTTRRGALEAMPSAKEIRALQDAGR